MEIKLGGIDMPYKVEINTDAYVCRRCSKKDWEPGTMNDFMIALNGWHTTEKSLREVYWRLMMFRGNDWISEEWDKQNERLSDRYQKWREKKCNWVHFTDRLCGIERMHRPCGYGFMQGYFNATKYIETLKKDGYVHIPFSALYDIRQYYKGQNGCYMSIMKI